MRLVILFLLVPLLVSGCFKVFVPVKVPTKCEIPERHLPDLTSKDIVENIRQVFIYSNLLKKDLEFCRTGK